MSKVTKDEIRIELYPQISNINSSKYKKKYKKKDLTKKNVSKINLIHNITVLMIMILESIQRILLLYQHQTKI